jgi:hypothetical protein
MSLIYKGIHLSEFARLEFCDKESGALPAITSNMTNDELRAVFGECGVVVAPRNDTNVEIEIYENLPVLSETTFVDSGQIMVGNQGLVVGSAPDYDEIAWPAGATKVSVYMDDARFGWAGKVVFVLERQA